MALPRDAGTVSRRKSVKRPVKRPAPRVGDTKSTTDLRRGTSRPVYGPPVPQRVKERNARQRAEVRDVKSRADLHRGDAHKRSPEYREALLRAATRRELARAATGTATRAGVEAGAIKVLEQTLRPVHGLAAGSRAALEGRNVLKSALRGVQLKDKSLFSDVIKAAGYSGPGAGTAGFILDVALDPLTYVTAGAGSVARNAAVKASRQAERRALSKGLSEEQARRFGERALAQTLRRTPDARGVSVRFAGRELPGVTRATARAGRGARAVGRNAPGARSVRAGLRHLAADVNPNIVPQGLARGEYAEIRQATRTARHSISRATYRARQEAQAVQRAIGPEDYRTVLDAIEAGAVRKLPAHLQQPAQFLQSRFKYIRRIEKQAGIRGATRQNYVPHVLSELLERGEGMGAVGVGRRTIRPTSSRARKDRRTLAEIRATDPGKYVEDPGVLYAARMQEGALAHAQARLNQRLGQMGRTIPRGRELALGPSEAVYHLRGSDIRKLDPNNPVDAREIRAVVTGGGRNGRYVVLNDQAVDRALKTVVPANDRSAYGLFFDKAQGLWKLAATQPNPGFHVRNFVGDLQNHFLATSGQRIPGDVRDAARVLRALGRDEQALKTLDAQPKPVKGTVRTRYGDLTPAQLAKGLEQAGALRSGFQSRELHDLLQAGMKGTGNRFQRLRRWSNNREDIFRAATAIDGLKRGMTFEEAAAHASRFHFDYSDVTELERKVLRRVMPFYTFSARNIPLQFRSLITRPGKYAQYEKVREELAKHFGYEDGWEKDLPEREQRSVPLPVEINGKRVTLSLGPSGLPLTDLNEFPTTTNPAKQADEWINRAMSLVTPAIKTPVELWANMSFFFRDQIERDEGPLVPLSSLVAKTVPKRFHKDLGIVPDYVDKRTGKKGWGAPAKLVYVLGVLPGPASFLNRVTTQSDRPGQSPAAKSVAYLGLRAVQMDPGSARIERLYEERGKISKKMRALNQRGVYATSGNREYDRLREQEKRVTSQIMALRTKRGDKMEQGGAKPKSFGDPDIDRALQGLRKERSSRFDDPEIEAALAPLRNR